MLERPCVCREPFWWCLSGFAPYLLLAWNQTRALFHRARAMFMRTGASKFEGNLQVTQHSVLLPENSPWRTVAKAWQEIDNSLVSECAFVHALALVKYHHPAWDALALAIFDLGTEGGMPNIFVLVRMLQGAVYWKPKHTAWIWTELGAHMRKEARTH